MECTGRQSSKECRRKASKASESKENMVSVKVSEPFPAAPPVLQALKIKGKEGWTNPTKNKRLSGSRCSLPSDYSFSLCLNLKLRQQIYFKFRSAAFHPLLFCRQPSYPSSIVAVVAIPSSTQLQNSLPVFPIPRTPTTDQR